MPRDLHDTLGQKLSMIGLKSDLAAKLMTAKPEKAKKEVEDIQHTARNALKEVREMVSNMRGMKLKDELIRVQQIIEAAEMEFTYEGNLGKTAIPVLTENVLSMCLKEAATNIVKHSRATRCHVQIEASSMELTVTIEDDGIGLPETMDPFQGHGLQGMRERLEFVNGRLDLESEQGTKLTLHIPTVIQQGKKEELL